MRKNGLGDLSMYKQFKYITGSRLTHGMSRMRFYEIWKNMKRRCNDKTNKRYKNYGGRGITYDPRWEEFLEFKRDMYFDYLRAIRIKKIRKPSIERKDVNGNYCKENCCWIPFTDQSKNQTKNKLFFAISPNGKKYKNNNQCEFARIYGLHPTKVGACLLGKRKTHKKWTFKYTKRLFLNRKLLL